MKARKQRARKVPLLRSQALKSKMAQPVLRLAALPKWENFSGTIRFITKQFPGNPKRSSDQLKMVKSLEV
jgi:hypothetical protein